MAQVRKLPPGKSADASHDIDPREAQGGEVIDLASRVAYPAVTQRKGVSDGLGLAAGVALVAGLGAVSFWAMNSARVEQTQAGGQSEAATPVVANAPAPAPVVSPGAAKPSPAAKPIAPVSRGTMRGAAAPQPVYASRPASVPSAQAAPAANPYTTPTLVFDAGGAPLGSVAVPESIVTSTDGQPVAGSGSAGDFAARVGGVGGGPAQASALVNPATTVTQGTLIPAVLETAIDTNVPGFVRAVVSQDVRSFDGTRVLVPRSSRLIGQYQSGLQNGQKRAYVIWTRLIRPDGASVSLQSPAVSFDGTTGLEGKVKSNFFQRFGSAMLLSVVGGLSAIGTGGASVVLGGGGQAAAAAAAQQDGQIGPTIRVKQGAPIRVFTARDLDFSQVG